MVFLLIEMAESGVYAASASLGDHILCGSTSTFR
jgi:hypothetical protein